MVARTGDLLTQWIKHFPPGACRRQRPPNSDAPPRPQAEPRQGRRHTESLVAKLHGAAETGGTPEPGADRGKTQHAIYVVLGVVTTWHAPLDWIEQA